MDAPVKGNDLKKKWLASTRVKPNEWVGGVALALLTSIGQLKASPALAWVPVDLTAVMTVLVFALAVWFRIKDGAAHKTVFIPIGLMLIFLLGFINSPMDDYARIKIATLYTVTLVCVVAPFYMLRTGLQRRYFLYSIVSLGVVVALVLFIWPEHLPNSAAIQFQGTNTIGTARMAGAALVVVALVAFYARGKYRLLLVVLSLILLPAILLTGSRGSLLAAIAAASIVLFAIPAFRRGAIVIVSGAVVIAAVWLGFSGTNGERFLRLLTGSPDSSVDTRWDFWVDSVLHFQPAPWGIGWGGFPHTLGSNPTGNLYPHNVILEVLLEAGWFAGLAFVACLIGGIVAIWRRSNHMVAVATCGLFLFVVFNAMVSGDVNGNRLMWVLLGCALMMIHLPKAFSRERPRTPVV